MHTDSTIKLDSLASRFWALSGRRSIFECWHWQGTLSPSGYGDFAPRKGEVGCKIAHRMAYLIHYGSIPEGLMIRHLCAQRDCVNPFHLRAGADAENKRDRRLWGSNSIRPEPRSVPRPPRQRVERLCEREGCGQLFIAVVGKAPGRFCSHACRNLWLGETGQATMRAKAPSTEQRFWRRVEKTESCYLWLGAKGDKGHGVFSFNGRQTQAHRAAWEMKYGPIPEGLCVLHNCPNGDNASCVNTDHLWLGTIADNNRDMFAKGRGATGDRHPSRHDSSYLPHGDDHWSRRHPERVPRGADHIWAKNPAVGEAKGSAKLTEDDVREIRRRVNAGESRRQVAFAFGVSPHIPGRIMRGLIWKHVI